MTPFTTEIVWSEMLTWAFGSGELIIVAACFWCQYDNLATSTYNNIQKFTLWILYFQ